MKSQYWISLTIIAIMATILLIAACEKKMPDGTIAHFPEQAAPEKPQGPKVEDCNVVKFTTMDGFSTCTIRCIWVLGGVYVTESTEVACGTWYGKKFKMEQ